MNKGFSIIIVCYNSSSLLKETIQSIAWQILGGIKGINMREVLRISLMGFSTLQPYKRSVP